MFFDPFPRGNSLKAALFSLLGLAKKLHRFPNFTYFIKWLIIVAPVSIVIGSACAFFLWSLEQVTTLHFTHPWLLFLLPLGGALICLIYQIWGKSTEAGNNLIMEQIHEPNSGVPARMAPLVLIGTIVTHLLGGSAGREGTAVQMGGSLASVFARWLKFDAQNIRTMLMVGIAAGFGGVFGTPLAGGIFALEVLAIGRMSYENLIPCFMAALIANWTCMAWGVHHTHYQVLFTSVSHSINILLFGKVIVASIAFGLASRLFAELTHGLQKIFNRIAPQAFLRPVLGGCIVIAMVYLLGTHEYLGLGVTSPDPKNISIVSAFEAPVDPWAWWWKTLFTSVTIGSGFKGGEVTPLFFIGATLGNTMAWLLKAPTDLFASIGFVALFAGSANTPLACTLMAIELFGPDNTALYATACFLTYLFSGHSGIYLSQRIGIPKPFSPGTPAGTTLRAIKEMSPGPGWFFSKTKAKDKNTPLNNEDEL